MAESLTDIEKLLIKINSVREAIISFEGPKKYHYILQTNWVIDKLLKDKIKSLGLFNQYNFPTAEPRYVVPNNNGYNSNRNPISPPNNGYNSNRNPISPPKNANGGRRKRTRKHKNRRRRTHRK